MIPVELGISKDKKLNKGKTEKPEMHTHALDTFHDTCWYGKNNEMKRMNKETLRGSPV